jgi:hypothetical protein
LGEGSCHCCWEHGVTLFATAVAATVGIVVLQLGVVICLAAAPVTVHVDLQYNVTLFTAAAALPMSVLLYWTALFSALLLVLPVLARVLV